ncbi:hypothetical protein L484_004044 [Morus notabilis]|uniref:Uncharacterized protein n=1 Tax=Morus notabilis TaxID=981085 RepID=W9RZ05_9ROSA|nr:hypothetical protein L484_004044 [Morus notabilis]
MLEIGATQLRLEHRPSTLEVLTRASITKTQRESRLSTLEVPSSLELGGDCHSMTKDDLAPLRYDPNRLSHRV